MARYNRKKRSAPTEHITIQELMSIPVTEDYQQAEDADYGLDKFIDRQGEDYNYDPDNNSYYQYQEQWDSPENY